MTKTLVLDEDGIESLNSVVDYCFQDEMEDYIKCVSLGDLVDCHVFVSLVALHNLLHGHTCKPEDFLDDTK